MIEKLVMAVPSFELKRDHLDPIKLANFERVTGIRKTRRWQWSTTELALKAAERFRDYPFRIDAVMVVTQSPDRCSPCMAVEIQRELGLGTDTMCFDVNQSCCGFIYALEIANRLGMRTLVVLVDRLRSHSENPLDELIFSDSACAMVMKGADLSLPIFYTDGNGAKKLCADSDNNLHMDGGAVSDFVSRNIPKLVGEYIKDCIDPPDMLCLHQPNLAMMELIERKTGFVGNSLHSIHEYGNMSMNSIPVTLASNEKFIAGKYILLVGFGAGWSVGICKIAWSNTPITEIIEV